MRTGGARRDEPVVAEWGRGSVDRVDGVFVVFSRGRDEDDAASVLGEGVFDGEVGTEAPVADTERDGCRRTGSVGV